MNLVTVLLLILPSSIVTAFQVSPRRVDSFVSKSTVDVPRLLRQEQQQQQNEQQKSTTSSSSSTLPPVLQHIADERREFQLNLGKAMDTLRRDMPDILRRTPGT